MVLLQMRFRVDPAQRTKVIRSLSGILGPLRTSPGCRNCHFYTDLEDNSVLLFAEEWIDWESLIAHLQTDNTKVLLSALDFASDPPQVRLDSVIDTKGIEFIAECRDCNLQDD